MNEALAMVPRWLVLLDGVVASLMSAVVLSLA